MARSQDEIRRESAMGFSTLGWIGDDLSEFVLRRFSPDEGLTAETVFLALLKRRALNHYGVDLDASTDISGWGTVADWEKFEAAATTWLAQRMAAPISAGELRANALAGKGLKKLAERRCESLGWRIERISRELAMTSSDLGNVWVYTYFEANRGGFAYWQDILLPGERVASLRESYLSMFGVSSQTAFHDLSAPSAALEAAARFVVAEAVKLLEHIRTAR